MKLILASLILAFGLVPSALPQSYSGPVTLDDFTTFRVNHDTDAGYYCNLVTQNPAAYSNCLWPGQPNQGPTICSVPVAGALSCISSGGVPPDGVAYWFNTLSCDSGGCYDLANSRLPSYIMSGTWFPAMNRYYFSYQCSVAIAAASPGAHWLEIGTYIRQPVGGGVGYGQGNHYYHVLNAGSAANEWVTVRLDRQPQHLVGRSPNVNWDEDPEWNAPTQGDPNHYYNGMTHYYFGPTYAPALKAQNVTCNFGPMTLDYVTGEPDAFVSGITGVYNPTSGKYDLSWNGPKGVPGGTLFDIRYSTSEIHALGFTNATNGGTTTGQDTSPYTNNSYSTPTVARAGTMYVAIRPHMYVGSVTVPGAIQIQTGPHSSDENYGQVAHFLTTGDAVTVANVCANANGARTVTVVDRFNVTLNGTSGPCVYTSGGTITTTSNATGFAELNITPPPSGCNITGTLPNGTVGVAYGSHTLTAVNCGGGTLTWTVSVGSLPGGLTGCSGTTGATCAINGMPTTTSGSPFSYTIHVTDGGSNIGNQGYITTINPAPTVTGLTKGGRIGYGSKIK